MDVTLRGVARSFGQTQVLHGIDLHVPSGGVTAILGPSGCGKTTLLRLIAGFDAPDAGTISIGDRLVADAKRSVPPEQRRIGYVAQEGALFPHLTVGANIAFGLGDGYGGQRHADTVDRLLEIVDLDGHLVRRYPHELSGGQQQRVALARALAVEPAVVLLDEPFSSLDAGLREGTRRTVLHALAATNATAILVTHDQAEALSSANQVAVMRAGRLIQVGTPAAVYFSPVDLGVARFLGDAVVLPGAVRNGLAQCALGRRPVRDAIPDGPAEVLIRPEQIAVGPVTDEGGIRARVIHTTYYGPYAQVQLALDPGGEHVTARVPGYTAAALDREVCLSLHGDVAAFPPQTRASSQ
ncbi:MAG: ABC transporter ATP-binding protein [Chloroflexi bacterium]|nr:ABC transporter ATP-binding protein [Chloroflexota bacterium]